MRFANRTAVVTGAAQGIGLATAAALLEEGASVVLADIDETALTDACDALPREFTKRAVPVVCDVGNARQVNALMAYAVDHFGSLDSVVTAAGTVHRSVFPEVSEEDFDRIIRTNLKGTFLCVQAAARTMAALRERGRDILGSIVLMGGDDAFAAVPNIVAHSVAAAGISRMAASLARPLAAMDVRINAVAAGLTDTRFLRMAAGTGKTAINAGLARMVQSRAADAEEIARVILFLASADASATTGQTIGTGAD